MNESKEKKTTLTENRKLKLKWKLQGLRKIAGFDEEEENLILDEEERKNALHHVGK